MSNNPEQQQLFASGPLAEAATALHASLTSDETARTAIFDSLELRTSAQTVEPDIELVADEVQVLEEAPTAVVSESKPKRRYLRNKPVAIGVIAAAATLVGVGNSDKLSDIKDKPYKEKVGLAIDTLRSHPLGKTKLATLHGTGGASLYVETPYHAQLSRDYRNEGRPRPIRYHEHFAYATATGTASVIAKRGFVLKLVDEHKLGAPVDQGWSLKAVINADKIITEQNEMKAVQNARTTPPDPWLLRKILKIEGIEAGRFQGPKSFIDEWAGKVMADRCADNPQALAIVPGRIRSEITKYIKRTADALESTNQEQAFVLRNLLPVKKVVYANDARPVIEKQLLPGRKLLSKKLHVDSSNVTVGVSGYCKPQTTK